MSSPRKHYKLNLNAQLPCHDESSMNDVGYTCQVTAAFRAVELQNATDPIIRDTLAIHMAGEALSTAFHDWQKLVASQGPGKSLRVPARNRIMDDLLMQTLQHISGQSGQQVVQVVNLGCGMDSKPWRLRLPIANVRWYDVDQPAVLQLKKQLLQSAGADVASPAGSNISGQLPLDSSLPHNPRYAAMQGSDDVSSSKLEQQQQHPQSSYPLLVDHWQPVAADLAEAPMAECLQAAGFQQGCCTVWLAEALLYYLPLTSACELLHTMHQLSGAGSHLIATCINKELQLAHLGLSQDHYFASSKVSWYFSMDDLEQGRLRSSGWQMKMPPRTTAELALEWYGRETYIALYGGAECCFTAVLV